MIDIIAEGVVRMKWDYESICFIEKSNIDNSPLFQPLSFGQSIMKKYVMWLWINEIKFDLSFNNRLEYLSKCYSISSELTVMSILNSDMSKEEQEMLIYFYYLKEEEINKINDLMNEAEKRVKKLYEKIGLIYHNQEKELLDQLKDPNYMKKLVNINFAEDIKRILYISLVDSSKMNLYYDEKKGVVLALGYEFQLEKIQEYDHGDTLNKLKALGDDTRLRILELILEKYMSASELSLILDLTIPTIAHHLKVLGVAGIITSFIENESSSRVSYKIYNPGIDLLIENINILNSGGVK